jgi:uncharacterized protein
MVETSESCSFVSSKGGQVLIKIRLAPRASKNRVAGIHNGCLKIAVTAPPVDGRANKHLIEFLAKILGCAKSKLELVSGQTSREKVVSVSGVAEASVRAALDSELPSA